MYCIHCGTELIDGSCPKCAEEATGEQPKNTVACIKEKPKQEELPRDTTLALVVVIAIFGMSSIAIFYLLKQKDIIH